MTKSLAVGTAVVVVLAGLQYGYIVLRAPTQVETLVPPARPHIGLIGFDEPLPQPKVVIPRPEPCYAVMVIQPGKGRINCLDSTLTLAPPVVRWEGKVTVETIKGQRRKQTEEVIK